MFAALYRYWFLIVCRIVIELGHRWLGRYRSDICSADTSLFGRRCRSSRLCPCSVSRGRLDVRRLVPGSSDIGRRAVSGPTPPSLVVVATSPISSSPLTTSLTLFELQRTGEWKETEFSEGRCGVEDRYIEWRGCRRGGCFRWGRGRSREAVRRWAWHRAECRLTRLRQ